MNLQITNGRKDKSFTEELELLQRIAEDIPESFSISHAFWTAPLIRLRRNAMLYLELNDPEGIGISQLVSDLNSSSHSGSIDKKSEELFSRCGSLAWDRKHYWAFLVIRFYKFGDVDPLSLYRSIQDAVGRQVDCKLWSEVISSIHAHSDELQDRPDKIIASLTYTLPPVNAEIFNEDQVRSLFKILQTVPYNDRFDSYGRQVIHIALNYSDVYKAFFQENNWGTLREGALALGLHDWALDASSQPPEEEYSKLNYLWRSYHADQREGQDLPEHVSEFREILAFTRKYMHNESVVPMHSKHEGEYGSEAGDVLLALISGNGLLKTDEYPNKILSLKSKIAFTKWSLNLSRDSDWIEVLEKDLKKASAPIVRSALLSCGRHADERARALGDKEEKKVARLSTKEILKLSSRGWDVTSVLSNPWRSNDWSFNIDRTEAEELIAAAIRLDVRGIDGRKSMRRWIGSKLFCNRQILDINPSRFPSKWEVFWDKVLRRRLSRGRSWDKSLRYYARFMDSETVNEIQKLREESVEIENTTERIGGNYWSSGKVFITVCIVMLLIGVVWYFFGNRYFVGGALEFLLPMVKILDKWFRLW